MSLSAPYRICACLLLALLASSSCGDADEAPRPRYNVLMIGVDTLRANHLGTYGYEKPTSPRIDEFFESAIAFDDAHSASAWTLPSFASVMTSVYSSTHECWNFADSLRPRFNTLAETLQASGYQTGAVVSHVFLRKQYGLHQGFENYDQSLAMPSLKGSHKQKSSPGLTEKAIAYLEARALEPEGEPWFLWVHYFDPHWLYQKHEGLTELFGETKMDRYDGEIAFTDRYIGELLDRLRTLHLDENTIVVFISDHGEEFMDHGRTMHGQTLFTEVERIPLAIRYPGLAPRRVAAPVSGVDVMPTLLSLLDLPVPSQPLAGRSLEPWMRGESVEASGVLLESRLLQRPDVELEAFATADWKLILENPREGSDLTETQVLLFDRRVDPAELENVAAANPEVVEKLQRELRRNVDEARKLRRGAGGPKTLDLTDEELRDLKALGYVGDLPEEDLEDE